MTCCLIVSTQEMETFIILGMLTLWAPFHVEQNSLYLFFDLNCFLNTFDTNLTSLIIDLALKTVLLRKKTTIN